MYVNVHKKRSLAMIYCLFRACVDNFGRPRFRFCPIAMVLAAAGTQQEQEHSTKHNSLVNMIHSFLVFIFLLLLSYVLVIMEFYRQYPIQ